MKILHITPKTNGYEEVTLLANRISKTNGFAVIQKDDGEKFMTGGFLIQDMPETRKVLDSVPKEQQYDLFMLLRVEPVVGYSYNLDEL